MDAKKVSGSGQIVNTRGILGSKGRLHVPPHFTMLGESLCLIMKSAVLVTMGVVLPNVLASAIRLWQFWLFCSVLSFCWDMPM